MREGQRHSSRSMTIERQTSPRTRGIMVLTNKLEVGMPAIGSAPIPLPADVVDYVTQTFQLANDEVSARLDRMPTMHEENLDFTFVDALASATGPHVVPSGVIVDFEVHFVGSGNHWGRWEVADLGLIVNFRQSGVLVRTKVVLLQSKRLYPNEADFVEFRGLARWGGFGSLMDGPQFPAQVPRTFSFTDDCRYKALKVDDDQWAAIKAYEDEYSIPVHYLLYHPSDLPYSREVPTLVPLPVRTDPLTVGARVMSARDVRSATTNRPHPHAPSFADLRREAQAPGLPVQEFIRDEVLTCRQGYVTDSGVADPGLFAVFNQRSGPIAAAIRFDIDVPEGLRLPEHAEGEPLN